jgi:fatty acid/phospholipid synthesis protein PlsX
MRIAVDAMGGDHGPAQVAQGVFNAARHLKAQFFLVGDPVLLEAERAKARPCPDNVEIVPATQVIEMTDAPTVAFKKKPDASVVVAARLVKDKKADALVTIGNTGAAMAVSLLTLGRIRGIDRPAIATPLPTSTGKPAVLLDAGATVDCDPNNLYEFALMGSVYAEQVLGIQQPRVGLLSNGEESSKGNDLVKRTHALFKQVMADKLAEESVFNFIGNVEGRDIFRGNVDVAVCDGFVGNVVLKTGEGVAEMMMTLLRAELSSRLWMKPLVAPLLPGLRRMRERIDYAEHGGAPLLGVNGVCIIGHGRSNARAVENACRAAERAIRHNVVETIRQRVCDKPSPVWGVVSGEEAGVKCISPLPTAYSPLPSERVCMAPQAQGFSAQVQSQSDFRAGIVGLGMCVPDNVVTNGDLALRVDTNDEWIVSRTGIRERRVAGPETATSDLATVAAQRALTDAGMEAADLDLVLCATTSGDYVWPATACVVQHRIGATRAAAFDLGAACSGFCYGLATAAGFIQSGAMRRILVIGADTLTKHLNWDDRSTCILFGDGAGAAVVAPCAPDEGVLASVLGSDGGGVEAVWVPAGGTRTPTTPEVIAARLNCLTMRGQEVYRFAVKIVPEVVAEALKRACLHPCDISLLVLHQANIRIVRAAADRLEIPLERVYVNLDRYGNTSAASVPMALTEAAEQGRLHRGDIVVTVGFGAGLTWGANVIRWSRE